MEVLRIIDDENSVSYTFDIDNQNYYNLNAVMGEFNTDSTPEGIFDELMVRYRDAWKKLAEM